MIPIFIKKAFLNKDFMFRYGKSIQKELIIISSSKKACLRYYKYCCSEYSKNILKSMQIL